MNKLAQINLYDSEEGFTGFGQFGLAGPLRASEGGILLNRFISTAIGVITIIAFIWFVFIIITGAISIMSSGGDKQALEGAKKRISTGIIGLVVLVSSIFIVSLVGTILGVSILNPAELINQISR